MTMEETREAFKEAGRGFGYFMRELYLKIRWILLSFAMVATMSWLPQAIIMFIIPNPLEIWLGVIYLATSFGILILLTYLFFRTTPLTAFAKAGIINYLGHTIAAIILMWVFWEWLWALLYTIIYVAVGFLLWITIVMYMKAAEELMTPMEIK